MEEEDQTALDNIENYGCHILGILEGEGEPNFSYSIGINKKQNKPDIVIVGLKSDLAHSIINNYKDRLLAGESFEPGKFYSDFLGGFDVCFERVSLKHYSEYFGWGIWLHDGYGFDVLQLIWPTTDDIWPWDENKSDYYKWAQPILNDKGFLKKF